VFGSGANQSKREDVDGYKASTVGVAMGADARIATAARMGIAVSYGSTGVKGSGDASGNKTDIDSVRGTIYADYTGSPWYLEGQTWFAHHSYTGKRDISFAGVTAKSDYTGTEEGFRIGGGWPLPVKKFTVTPLAGFEYAHTDIGGYTETGAGGANLKVASQSRDNAKMSIGAKVARTYQGDNNKWTPDLHLMYGYDVVASQVATTASYTGGGSTFTTNGMSPARNSFNLGAGVNVANRKNFDVVVQADTEFRESYIGYSGQVKLRKQF
jgi:outer membrane autotransporter protein